MSHCLFSAAAVAQSCQESFQYCNYPRPSSLTFLPTSELSQTISLTGSAMERWLNVSSIKTTLIHILTVLESVQEAQRHKHRTQIKMLTVCMRDVKWTLLRQLRRSALSDRRPDWCYFHVIIADTRDRQSCRSASQFVCDRLADGGNLDHQVCL